MLSIPISPAAARAVRRGHPWLYGEPTGAIPVGTPVVLRERDAVVGWGIVDHGEITVRVLGRGAPADRRLAQVIASRVRDADEIRWRLAPADTNCWRVVAAAADGLPGLVVDRYAELAVVRVYSAAWEPHLDAIVAAIAALPWVGTVFRRLGVRRVDDREGGEVLRGPAPPDAIVVREAGIALLVRPWVGQKTGLFLDQRENRALIGRIASGRRVANLFGYNGGFSIAAALGGAARVTTVDLAPEAIADAREVFRLNGVSPDAHGFEVADAFAWAPPAPVDLLVVDPPALTRGARSDHNAARAYVKLHAGLGAHVARTGLLATSSCTARLSLERWRAAVEEGLAATGPWSWHGCSTHAPDHPVALAHDEAWYLKFGLLRRRRADG